MRERVWALVDTSFGAYARYQAEQGIALCAYALHNLGMVVYDAPEADGGSTTGAVDFAVLESTLKLPAFADKISEFKRDAASKGVGQVTDRIARRFRVMEGLYRVLTVTLISKFPIYSAMHVIDDNEIKMAAAFAPSKLAEIGASTENISVVADDFLSDLRVRANVVREKSYDAVKTLVNMFLSGNHAGVTEKAAKDVVKKLPPDGPITAFAGGYLQVVARSCSALDDVKAASAQRKLVDSLLGSWPSPECEYAKRAGFTEPIAKTRLETLQTELRALCDNARSTAFGELEKACAQGLKSASNLNPDDEPKFRQMMKSKSAALASAQGQIQRALAAAKAAYAADSLAFENEEPSLSKKAGEVDATCMYLVCTFAAIVFYRSESTWAMGKEAQEKQAKLKATLAALTTKLCTTSRLS